MTIKEFRMSKGFTQGELADALGISVSSERSYEYGVRQPSAAVLAKIMEVYGVDLNAPAEEEKKPAKRARKKKEETAVEEKKATKFIIQSRMGGEIALEDILARVGDVDTLYIKPEDNAAYWVRGEQSGAINLW